MNCSRIYTVQLNSQQRDLLAEQARLQGFSVERLAVRRLCEVVDGASPQFNLPGMGGSRLVVEGAMEAVLLVRADGERYVFVFDRHTRAEVLRIFGRYAGDPNQSFTWYDAAMLSQTVRRFSETPPFIA